MKVPEYGVFFSYNGRTARMPVNPETLSVKQEAQSAKEDILDIGEVARPRHRSLTKVEWEGFFPFHPQDPFVLTASGFAKPKFYVDFFMKCMEERGVGRLVITRAVEAGANVYETNLPMTVESFKTTDQGGEPGDIYYAVSLLEYREAAARRVQIQIKKAPPPQPARPAPASKAPYKGCTVIANGDYHYDSYGASPKGTFRNFQGKVNLIVTKPASGQKYPYHVTTMSGGYRGWVRADQLQVVG